MRKYFLNLLHILRQNWQHYYEKIQKQTENFVIPNQNSKIPEITKNIETTGL